MSKRAGRSGPPVRGGGDPRQSARDHYPRMAETCLALVALDDALLDMTWTDAVARMTAGALS